MLKRQTSRASGHQGVKWADGQDVKWADGQNGQDGQGIRRADGQDVRRADGQDVRRADGQDIRTTRPGTRSLAHEVKVSLGRRGVGLCYALNRRDRRTPEIAELRERGQN